jgi:hypothetical protein
MYFNTFITFVFIVKIIFILLSILIRYIEKNGSSNKKLIGKLNYWRDRLEFIFIVCMAAICIYLFGPFFSKKVIGGETRLLLFAFGIIILITSDWGLFFKQSKWFTEIQKIIGNI